MCPFYGIPPGSILYAPNGCFENASIVFECKQDFVLDGVIIRKLLIDS